MASKSYRKLKLLVLGNSRLNDSQSHYCGLWDPARSASVHVPKLISQHSLPSFITLQLSLPPFSFQICLSSFLFSDRNFFFWHFKIYFTTWSLIIFLFVCSFSVSYSKIQAPWGQGLHLSYFLLYAWCILLSS